MKKLKGVKICLGISQNSHLVEIFRISSINEGSVMIFPNQYFKTTGLKAQVIEISKKKNKIQKNVFDPEKDLAFADPKIHFHKSGIVEIKSQKDPNLRINQKFTKLVDFNGNQAFSITIVNPGKLPKVAKFNKGDVLLFEENEFKEVYAIGVFIQNCRNIRSLDDLVEVTSNSGFINNGSQELAVQIIEVSGEKLLISYKFEGYQNKGEIKLDGSSMSLLCLSNPSLFKRKFKAIHLTSNNHKLVSYAISASRKSPLYKLGKSSQHRDLKRINRAIEDKG